MTVADDVTLDDLILAKDDLSGADIKVRAQLVTLKSVGPITASLLPANDGQRCVYFSQHGSRFSSMGGLGPVRLLYI